MSCRHDMAIGNCTRCYPTTGHTDPGPEEDYEPNLNGPGAAPRSLKDEKIFWIETVDQRRWVLWNGVMATYQEANTGLNILKRTWPGLQFRIKFQVMGD